MANEFLAQKMEQQQTTNEELINETKRWLGEIVNETIGIEKSDIRFIRSFNDSTIYIILENGRRYRVSFSLDNNIVSMDGK